MLKRQILSVAVIAAFALSIAPPAQASPADVVSLSAEDLTFLESQSQVLGIEVQVRDRLIANLKQGKLPESSTGATPVSTVTDVEPGFEVTTKTFSDGSVSKSSIQIPKRSVPGAPVMFDISECRDTSGVGVFPFTNCKVRTNQFTFNIEYRADGALGTNGNNRYFTARIDRIYGSQWSGVGSASGPRDEMLNQYQSGSTPASARSSYQVSIGLIGATQSLTFYVQDNRRWDTSP
ncbi:hypothetical protein [Arthrobacter russicus]|jgi:hypothetical protein|uniref:Secreted protein n=1 Tax=Arthrobacter russicus TaxID=172040 RepID=A0ABU1J703_9MICC|nr:hypothetical protein [Arthrobacter russicus]MDR6268203.1 hypothetical protein [Arthrobacter russicus]